MGQITFSKFSVYHDVISLFYLEERIVLLVTVFFGSGGCWRCDRDSDQANGR